MLRRNDSKPSMQTFISHQLSIQRQNLYNVCRLAVKSVIDRSSYGGVEDGCAELENLFTIIEHILNHRIKPLNTWYGALEPRCFWDFIHIACRRLPKNCIDNIEFLEGPKTAFGKGRAWLRMCLMEKRLSDYIAFSVQQTKLILYVQVIYSLDVDLALSIQITPYSVEHIQNFYDEGSIMLSDESALLAEVFLGLNCIDFSFDIKGIYLDYQTSPVIDFTPYLRFNMTIEGGYPSISHTEGSDASTTECEQWKSKFEKLNAQYKTSNEQRSYVEERLRMRERQLEELERSKERLIEAQRSVESEMMREHTQYEAVICELQAQLALLKEENRRYVAASHLLTQPQQQELLNRPVNNRFANQTTLTMSELIELDRLNTLDEGFEPQTSLNHLNPTEHHLTLSQEQDEVSVTQPSEMSHIRADMTHAGEIDGVSNIALAGSLTSSLDSHLISAEIYKHHQGLREERGRGDGIGRAEIQVDGKQEEKMIKTEPSVEPINEQSVSNNEQITDSKPIAEQITDSEPISEQLTDSERISEQITDNNTLENMNKEKENIIEASSRGALSRDETEFPDERLALQQGSGVTGLRSDEGLKDEAGEGVVDDVSSADEEGCDDLILNQQQSEVSLFEELKQQEQEQQERDQEQEEQEQQEQQEQE